MKLFQLNGLLMLGFSMVIVSDVMISRSDAMLVMDQEVPIRKCRYSRAYSMLQVQCRSLDLTNIPSHLQTGIQVLDASFNRMRSLSNNSFSDYTNLMYLDLGDNFIVEIEEATFSQLRYLEVLNLTRNGLQELPASLFKLPHLRSLYLADNLLTNKIFETDVTSPLTFIQLWNNKLTMIPDIGIQTVLTSLNISNNLIVRLSVEDIAPLCSLKILDLTNNPIKFNSSSCDCYAFNTWIKAHKIDVRPIFSCNNDTYSQCTAMKFSNRTLSLRQRCMDIIRIQIEAEKARATWILVASTIAGFIVFVFVALYCVHRRNKKRRQKSKNVKQLAAVNANTELLNSNAQQEQT